MWEADAGQLPARRAEGPRRAAPAPGCCCRGSSQEVVLLFPALSFLQNISHVRRNCRTRAVAQGREALCTHHSDTTV